MMRALLSVRFRAMFAGLMRQARQKKKKSTGMVILFAILYLYLAAVIVGMMCLTFAQLAPVYHAVGLDWLYFAMAGLMGLGLSIFGSVFTTQNQLYDARDNDLLLSMPIQPGAILMSRMIPLLILNTLFVALVMVPASVMYAILVKVSVLNLVIQLVTLMAVSLLSQAVCCLLGWGLHLLLSHINKSAASVLYMVLFLGIYFGVYSQMGSIMNAMTANAAGIASGLKGWAWPIYALGMGCMGDLLLMLAFVAISALAFLVVCRVLSVTFLRSATTRRTAKRRKLDLSAGKAGTAAQAILFKEWRHYLGSPVYLTNMGIGILMVAALAAAGLIFRGKLLDTLAEFAAVGLDLTGYISLIICGGLSFLVSTMVVSAPSVSLEGKNLWILKSMPLSARQILLAKLEFHLILTTPVTMAAGLVLSIAYGCDLLNILLCAVVPGLLTVLCGILGMVCGLRWAKLDWLSEAYPCKQGAAVAITMFSMMGLPVMLGLGYFFLAGKGLTPELFLALCAVILAAASFGLYRLLTTWGVRKWEML